MNWTDVMAVHDIVIWVVILAAGLALLYLYRDRQRVVQRAAQREAQQATLLAAAPDAVLRIEASGEVIIRKLKNY
jgi:PAS domain-containing protein